MKPSRSPCALCTLLSEPTPREGWIALGLATVFILATRGPIARSSVFDFDEIGYLEALRSHWLPSSHTLFLAAARGFGVLVGDAYRGFLVLSQFVSVLALVATWWWLRALVRPATAAVATLLLAVSPLFWSYGGLAASSYNAILLVGALLLGIAWRTYHDARPWHAYVAAVVLAVGAGYRSDIGMLWAPLFGWILWRQGWARAIRAGMLAGALTLAWFVPMLHDVGGWSAYRAVNGRFAHSAGYLNSVWNLGLIDATVRYAAKLGMALVLTLGVALLLVPRGLNRLARRERGGVLGALLALSVAPALFLHLLVHFGVPGYAFHYVPALLALIALGGCRDEDAPAPAVGRFPALVAAHLRLVLAGAVLAAFFLFYPTRYDRQGLRGDFDLAFARYTRAGLRTMPPLRVPASWRTANSIKVRGYPGSPEGAAVNSPGRQPRDGERRATNPLRSPEGATEPMVPRDLLSPLRGFGGGGRGRGLGSRG